MRAQRRNLSRNSATCNNPECVTATNGGRSSISPQQAQRQLLLTELTHAGWLAIALATANSLPLAQARNRSPCPKSGSSASFRAASTGRGWSYRWPYTSSSQSGIASFEIETSCWPDAACTACQYYKGRDRPAPSPARFTGNRVRPNSTPRDRQPKRPQCRQSRPRTAVPGWFRR